MQYLLLQQQPGFTAHILEALDIFKLSLVFMLAAGG